tara:strand:+ start:125 stop:304 length:180 start_codon:yes stop_codon:yes gene_type:complete
VDWNQWVEMNHLYRTETRIRKEAPWSCHQKNKKGFDSYQQGEANTPLSSTPGDQSNLIK